MVIAFIHGLDIVDGRLFLLEEFPSKWGSIESGLISSKPLSGWQLYSEITRGNGDNLAIVGQVLSQNWDLMERTRGPFERCRSQRASRPPHLKSSLQTPQAALLKTRKGHTNTKVDCEWKTANFCTTDLLPLLILCNNIWIDYECRGRILKSSDSKSFQATTTSQNELRRIQILRSRTHLTSAWATELITNPNKTYSTKHNCCGHIKEPPQLKTFFQRSCVVIRWSFVHLFAWRKAHSRMMEKWPPDSWGFHPESENIKISTK